MIDRSKSGIRCAGTRARLAIAAAVIVGGGAVSAVAVTASHSGATTAQSAAYTTGYRHTLSESKALTEGFGEVAASPASSLVTLAEMDPLLTFAQVRWHGVTLAAQRGVVVVATKKFIVVRSANGALHLWWISKGTYFKDVGATASGMAAMTGSNTAAGTAMATGDMMPAATVMAGSISAVTQMATTPARPATITIDSGGEVITITIASSTATVTQPVAMTMTQMTRDTQPAFRSTMGSHRGRPDLRRRDARARPAQGQDRAVRRAGPHDAGPEPDGDDDGDPGVDGLRDAQLAADSPSEPLGPAVARR